ncbi:PHP-associated domain-containing protein [Paenibacillus sacheonensis]|uniref:PHP domain-containing protein n=1 Tax=Paenibacillus sacheonensis TaxID=742054 RepID=A0A7X5BXY1_9BACL|nr:PHP-associated domain-containing protein [Paenibacillus sacheonensis]MBM7567087.1 histidinol phosphatase-like PHP family hydrolase [Paenibacillus sacheonensis]NBC70983.1 PHP domain-containing protein [Paenibacillus sacheonensis]
MKIDLHFHVKLSKKTNFEREHFDSMIGEARANGLDAITLTEHFNTHRFEDVYGTLDTMYPCNNHYYDADGFRIFTGMEVDVAEGGHILVSGPKDKLLEIRAALDDHTAPDRFIGLARLFELCEPRGMLVIGGHPFRESNHLYHIDHELLRRFDAFDLNGKDLHQIGIQENIAKVLQLGAELGVPVVAGSDAHQMFQVGCVHNAFAGRIETVAELKEAIRSGAYKREISPSLHLQVRAANMVKKLLKHKKEVV